MQKIQSHPILEIPDFQETTFMYRGEKVKASKGQTIAAALHQAGHPVHSHSLKNRNRSLECGIGKCGACEMLVDGEIRRICITRVDGVNEVMEIPAGYTPGLAQSAFQGPVKIYRTTVAIIGAGPAGLAAREELNKHKVDNLVLDNNDKTGGQFTMQTHQFFFFEKEKKYGGMRGFDIAKTLSGENSEGILLNTTVWDILEGGRIACKNLNDGEIFYVDAAYLIVATGAVPFMPSFENDDLPGVYTAAVIQKMMNNELTLLGRNVLTVGAGNIGYLTSYQLTQAGASVKAIIEAQPSEGGFPVQANRVRRLGIPILLSHILLKAIPNKDKTGITGAVIAECRNFEPVPGTEKTIMGIDAINICTGLVPDDQLLIKGREVFGRNCFGAGDAIRIGEGTSAVLKGRNTAMEILQELGIKIDYEEYLAISKEYIDSQQHPVRVLEQPALPERKRQFEKPFVLIDCLYGFACNPCEFSCPHEAIRKSSTSTVPRVNYDRCVGCMECVYQCPGLAIFGYNLKKDWIFLPVEHEVEEGQEVCLVDNHGKKVGEGVISKILRKSNKTHLARIQAIDVAGVDLMEVRGFIVKERMPEPLEFGQSGKVDGESFICHCDDVTMDEILQVVGNRKFISVDELKHTTRIGMGACRGKRCIPRLKQAIRKYGISVVGEPTPRGPLSNQVSLADLNRNNRVGEKLILATRFKTIRKEKTGFLIAGGGIGGSALYRYLAADGRKPVLVNWGRGASWRNIAGGRTAFTLPEISEIALNNLKIFRELQQISNIDFRLIRYVTFAHNDEMVKALDQSREWSDARLIAPEEFSREISPHFNKELNPDKYKAALITNNCWQASPGKVVDLLRQLGTKSGGRTEEDSRLIDLHFDGSQYSAVTEDHDGNYTEWEVPVFINALGPEADRFARMAGIETGLFPVRHQAFITRRLPMMGKDDEPLPMLIDRRNYKGFTAVYGQQLAETGQIIGCASPSLEPAETGKNLKLNSKDFLEIVSEVFSDWIPALASVGFQAVWSGYYVEPRMIIDPDNGLFIGLRGQGFMLGQYLAKLYTDKLLGRNVPDWFGRLALKGDGLQEKSFK